MCSPPRISVLLPYRDAGPTLEESVRSVLEERNVPLELIAVDDGSSDGGAELVRAWSLRDPRIVPLSTDGCGIAQALNLAARHARADVLARIDGDDVSLAGRFGTQLEALDRQPEVGVLGCQVEVFPERAVGEGLRLYVRWQNAIVSCAAHDRELFVESPLCHPSVVMRRAAFEAVGGYREGPFPEDYDLWLRLRAAGWRLAKVPRVLLRWRHWAGRMTFSSDRFAPDRFRALKAEHLAPRLRAAGRPVTVWGAGPTGRRLARALESHGVAAARFVDIDPRKIGRTARGVPIVSPRALIRGAELVLVAVGARGARTLIRGHLREHGFVEMDDFICAA